jgi:chromosome segregation ATPase
MGSRKAALARLKSALARLKSALARLKSALARLKSALARLKSALARSKSALARRKSALELSKSALARLMTAQDLRPTPPQSLQSTIGPYKPRLSGRPRRPQTLAGVREQTQPADSPSLNKPEL